MRKPAASGEESMPRASNASAAENKETSNNTRCEVVQEAQIATSSLTEAIPILGVHGEYVVERSQSRDRNRNWSR